MVRPLDEQIARHARKFPGEVVEDPIPADKNAVFRKRVKVAVVDDEEEAPEEGGVGEE